MKFSANIADVAKALALAGGVVESRTTIPILNHLLIRAEAGQVSIIGTDLERECTAMLDAEIAEAGAATVTCSILRSIVDKLPKAGTINFATANERTAVSYSRSRYALDGLDVEGFPARKHAGGSQFDVGAKALADLLGAAVSCVSTEETRIYLCGVFLHTRAEGLCAASTDGHRLIRRWMPMPAGAEDIPHVIIPTKGVQTMIALLGSSDGTARVWVTRERIGLQIKGASFSTALINAEFPDYERVIPRDVGPSIAFLGQEFAAAVERAAATMPDAKVVPAGMTSTPEGLVIRVGPRDHDTAVEHVEGTFYLAPEAEVAANSKYLAGMTKVWGTAPIRMQLGHRREPILFTSEALPEQLVCIMPMKR